MLFVISILHSCDLLWQREIGIACGLLRLKACWDLSFSDRVVTFGKIIRGEYCERLGKLGFFDHWGGERKASRLGFYLFFQYIIIAQLEGWLGVPKVSRDVKTIPKSTQSFPVTYRAWPNQPRVPNHFRTFPRHSYIPKTSDRWAQGFFLADDVSPCNIGVKSLFKRIPPLLA